VVTAVRRLGHDAFKVVRTRDLEEVALSSLHVAHIQAAGGQCWNQLAQPAFALNERPLPQVFLSNSQQIERVEVRPVPPGQ
jgi:hypothetical protein